MRILVHNFSSETTTEPMYFTQGLSNMGHETHLWSNDRSAFDMFDMFDPEVFITHASLVTNDIVKRLKGASVKCIINVTGMDAGVLPQVKALADTVYIYQNSNVLPDVPVVQYCADIFLPLKAGTPDYDIESLFLACNIEDVERINKFVQSTPMSTYHVIGTSRELNGFKNVDACLSIRELPSIYPKYKQRYCAAINQVFYDAAYHGGTSALISSPTISIFLKKEVVASVSTPYNRLSELFRMAGELKIAEESKIFTESVK